MLRIYARIISATLLIAQTWLLSVSAFAEDLLIDFSAAYYHHKTFEAGELQKLRNYEIILISGVLAEIATVGDKSAPLNLSLFSGDYFGEQIKVLRSNGVDVVRIQSSSRDIEVTKANLRAELTNARGKGKKIILMTHSLGGLVLLDHLIEGYPSSTEGIDGILFLQSPFRGSPIADLYLSNESVIKDIAHPFLPLVNLSEDTLRFLTVDARKRYMEQHADVIEKVLKAIPVITVSGISNGHKSVSTPMVEIMHHGCIGRTQADCSNGKIVYAGPYDVSDGMVPLKSSLLPWGDWIVLGGFDHTEAVLNQNYVDFEPQTLTIALIKVLLERVALARKGG